MSFDLTVTPTQRVVVKVCVADKKFGNVLRHITIVSPFEGEIKRQYAVQYGHGIYPCSTDETARSLLIEFMLKEWKNGNILSHECGCHG